MSAMNDNAKTLRSALHAAKLPSCVAGDIPISRDVPIKLLFEGPGHEDRTIVNRITFPLSSADDTKPLLDACKQASFGRGGEEVLDPSYRRALVLHAPSFAIAPASAVDPCGLGILPKIRRTLLSGSVPNLDEDVKNVANERGIGARLDKMNIYGAGDFFKGHVDTPQSNQMFGTLLINLPVAHKGGQLVVHAPYPTAAAGPEGDSSIVQSSDAGLGEQDSYTTAWGAEDVLSWVAFFSDCLHEVLPVENGNRVTLSYNLFFEDESDTSTLAVNKLQEPALERITSALKLPGNFDDSQPFVAFHLQHRYPVKLVEDQARAVEAYLKGGDALIYRALQAVGAKITFHYVYSDNDFATCSEQDFVLEETSQLIVSEDYLEEELQEKFNGRILRTLGIFTALEAPIVKYKGNEGQERQRKWNEPKFATATKFKYLAYGNDVTVRTVYASICMIASAPGYDIKSKWSEYEAPERDPFFTF